MLVFNAYIPPVAFRGVGGAVFSQRGTQWLAEQAVKKAGIIVDISRHTLRHRYATYPLGAGLAKQEEIGRWLTLDSHLLLDLILAQIRQQTGWKIKIAHW